MTLRSIVWFAKIVMSINLLYHGADAHKKSLLQGSAVAEAQIQAALTADAELAASFPFCSCQSSASLSPARLQLLSQSADLSTTCVTFTTNVVPSCQLQAATAGPCCLQDIYKLEIQINPACQQGDVQGVTLNGRPWLYTILYPAQGAAVLKVTNMNFTLETGQGVQLCFTLQQSCPSLQAMCGIPTATLGTCSYAIFNSGNKNCCPTSYLLLPAISAPPPPPPKPPSPPAPSPNPPTVILNPPPPLPFIPTPPVFPPCIITVSAVQASNAEPFQNPLATCIFIQSTVLDFYLSNQVHVLQPFVCIQALGLAVAVQGSVASPNDAVQFFDNFKTSIPPNTVMAELGVVCGGSYLGLSTCGLQQMYPAPCISPPPTSPMHPPTPFPAGIIPSELSPSPWNPPSPPLPSPPLSPPPPGMFMSKHQACKKLCSWHAASCLYHNQKVAQLLLCLAFSTWT
ncbi:hypothetical protein CEUSTIGMA_g8013.t1 [Chlamydomonas eustigma]|uniref:Pherophorin domain-containing protein n=1 Tax=Chlamydomonas eustigma TaxID=1157962 RepID=A0A250XBZ5_9CHLO|nr:hypothetical protein CEUSTIGMA_g8013.t1 [Chlamydomonas eustigma]|eukprot:GAX80576.1 hypothetical protein CEUSTIGMA_g8013.t1 [Chlamydomonas eustigma]